MDTKVSPTTQDIPAIIARGVATLRTGLVPRLVFAVAVLVVAGSARVVAQSGVDDGRILVPLLIDFSGMTVATVLALPWFKFMLGVERRGDATVEEAFHTLRWPAMLVGALFFWGGVFLGLRYLIGIPSVFVLIWYGFFAFAVAAGEASGLQALGTSVRIGQGRRAVVGVLALVLAFLNALAATPLGFGANPATAAATVVLLAVTTNVSMGAGAYLFVWLIDSEERPRT